ncbi:hypothetical protein [Streptomyces cavernae]|uniref:hypothetical protein n=1 Tax=Streptomyces cavernae TaxID=2259034 RepID=UPI000FEC1E17|nr:hypothetical protein [Streptomyces cavernae]
MITVVQHTTLPAPASDAAGLTLALAVARELHTPAPRAPEVAATPAARTPATPAARTPAARGTSTARRTRAARRRPVRG